MTICMTMASLKLLVSVLWTECETLAVGEVEGLGHTWAG
jgi:hypothetical protein